MRIGRPMWPARKTTLPPLPASAIEYWHSELGVSLVGSDVDSWTGQIRSTLLVPMQSPTSRPGYGPDGAHFAGKNVVQSFAAGQRALATAAITPALAPSGTRPHQYLVARNRSGGANQYFSCFVNTPIAGAYPGGILGLSGTGELIANWYPLGTATSAVPGTSPARVETYIEASTGTIRLRVNGTVVASVATGVSSTQPIGVVELGGDRSAGGFADASLAFVLLCGSEPSTLEMNALNFWAQTYWGVP